LKYCSETSDFNGIKHFYIFESLALVPLESTQMLTNNGKDTIFKREG